MSKLDAKIIATARAYIDKIRQNNIEVDSAYIFGSFARGNTHAGSDLDIAIVSPQFGINSIDERLTLMHLDLDPLSIIEPHPFSPADLEEKYNFLAQEAKQGIRIV
ncbi:MAG: nucleotidyltransferase domain-containing protein [Candidatus Pacebacteria bacterium]|jgi:predicted nucleotidyltransferase|nr:nucleotidyltransferase domain-containing protein [Candidatus Paceibacterota bacterium]